MRLFFFKTVVALCLIFSSFLVYGGLTFIKIKELEDAQEVFSLYQQLNTQISQKEYMDNFQSAIQHEYHFFKVVKENKPEKTIGLIGFTFVNEMYGGRFMRLDSFVVNNEDRRKTYGTKMFSFIIKTFDEEIKSNKCKSLRFETGISREEAQKFYDNLGVPHASNVGYRVNSTNEEFLNRYIK